MPVMLARLLIALGLTAVGVFAVVTFVKPSPLAPCGAIDNLLSERLLSSLGSQNKCLRLLGDHERVRVMAVHPDQQTVIFDDQGQLYRYNLLTGSRVDILAKHSYYPVEELSITQDGRFLASVSRDIVEVYDFRNSQVYVAIELLPKAETWIGISISRSGQFIAVGAGTNPTEIRLFNNSELQRQRRVIADGQYRVIPNANAGTGGLAFSPSSDILAYKNYRPLGIRIVNATDLSEVVTLQHQLLTRTNLLKFSPDGRWLAVGTTSGELLIYDTTSWALRHEKVIGGGGRGIAQLEWIQRGANPSVQVKYDVRLGDNIAVARMDLNSGEVAYLAGGVTPLSATLRDGTTFVGTWKDGIPRVWR